MTIETNSSTDSAENGDQSTGVMQNNDAGQSQETASSTAPKEGEKLLKQSEVNDIVKSVKQKTEERTRANILAESYATAQSAKENNLTKPNGSNNAQVDRTLTGNELSEERVRQMVSEESQRISNESIANQIANDFQQKIIAAKEKYPDIDEAVGQLNLASIPHLAVWANSLDNTADVIYEISKHPSKFANLLTLSQAAPHLAVMEMQKLSESIKKNQQATDQHKQANEPLDQIKPSTTGTDNGSMSVADFKKQSWLRG